MTEKQKPSKAPKAWRGKPVRPLPPAPPLPPIRYPDTPSKKLGNWLFSWLTPWQR